MLNSQPLSLEAKQLARLMEVGLRLNSTMNLEDLLQAIIRAAVDILDCEAASLLLHDERRNRLFFAASTNIDRQVMSQMLVPIDGSLAGSIFREGQPII